MSNALVVRQDLTPETWQMIANVAPAIHQSRLFGVASPEQAMAIMLKGHELGLKLVASFDFIHIINGKPGLSPRGHLALIHNEPECDGLKITRLADDKGVFIGYECWMKRKSGFEYTARFTVADAKRADLIKTGSGWEKYPENMCLYRSVGFCADVVFPDIGGLKRADELGAEITPDGEIVVEGEWANPASSSAPEQVTLDDLVQQYGPDKVMVAAGGKIPATQDELIAAAQKLQEAEQERKSE